jgi:uncharacterized protein YwgA
MLCAIIIWIFMHCFKGGGMKMFKRNVLNKLLLLKLIGMAEEINGATRLQKLVFSAEHYGRNIQTPTFNYSFIRWHYGPYSDEVKKDIDFLHENDFIDINNNTYVLTEKGEKAILVANHYFKESKIDEVLQAVLKRYEDMTLEDLLKRVYKTYKIESHFEKGEIILPVQEDEIGGST